MTAKQKPTKEKPVAKATTEDGKKKRQANLKPWSKGISGNPRGAALHSPELKMIKHLTEAELIEIGNLVIKNNMSALLAIQKDPEASVIKVMIASVAVKIISKGDMGALDVLLNRLVGKVKERLDVNNNHTGNSVNVLVSLPSNGREVR